MQFSPHLFRRAQVSDGEAVLSIERAAARRFASIGMNAIAQGVGLSKAHYDRFVALGAVFLCLRGSRPVAFAAACLVDGACHLAELDVLPEEAGQRLGSRLIDEVAAWGVEQRASCVSLTTFRSVPWNAPYYARLGFEIVSLAGFGPGHHEIWEGQRAMGLDMAERVLMARPLRSGLEPKHLQGQL